MEQKKVPTREFLMEPIIRQKGLVELYSGRGMGKTFLALSIAVAVATGNNLFHWKVPSRAASCTWMARWRLRIFRRGQRL